MQILSSVKGTADFTCGKLLNKRNEMEKRKKKVMLVCGKYLNIMMMAIMFIMMSGVLTFASSTSNGSASKLIGGIVGIILSMFRWVGVVLLVWGVAQFVMAIKRTDAESKSDAIQTIICAIVLISLKTVITALGIDGLSITDVNI